MSKRRRLNDMANPRGRGKTWKPHEIEILINNWANCSLETLSNKLSRSERAIELRADALGLLKKARRNATPPDVIEYVRDMAGKRPVKQIASELGMPPASVYTVGLNKGISFKAAKRAATR